MGPVLVTGAAGFIGSHLCERLLARGERVVAVDNFDGFYARAVKERNLAAFEKKPGCTFVEFDVRDKKKLEQLWAAASPSAVVHLAAKAGVRPSIEDPLGYEEVNVRGTLNILTTAAAHGTRDVVFASSSSVYGNTAKLPFSERDPVEQPISPYAATKKAGELLAHTYHHLNKLNVACLRFFTVYGPRQRPDLAIHKFTRAILEGRAIDFYGDGSTSRDYTYIDDIIDGVTGCLDWLRAQKAPRYAIYNLGNSHPVRLDELVRAIEKACGKKAVVVPKPMQDGDVNHTYADVEHAHAAFSFQPKVELATGLERFVAWLRAGA